MKKYVYLLLALMPALIICCAPPQSGQRVWDIATKNIFITQAVESSLDGLSSIDTIAAFSNLDQLLDQVTIVQSKALLLLQEVDNLENSILQDVSSTQQIQTYIQLIESNVALLDISSVFTALDALQTTIVSAMDLLNTDLEGIASNIDVLAASEVQYFQTVASQLDKLDGDVATVNSLLDTLSAQFSLTTFDSVTDLMQQDLVSLESNVDVLADQLEGGFEDTFGILDQNMLLAQTVASQTDNLDVMDDSDLTSTYSLLGQLEVSVQTIDSLVDLLIDTFENIESTIDVLGSALDESVSKYMFVESRTSWLVQKIQKMIIDPAFSRVDHATSLLDRDISLLEHAYAADLPALTTNIESKLDHIIAQQNQQISDLDTIATDFVRVATISNETVDIGRLSLVNSLLDDTIDDAFATESYIDPATHSEQLFVITDNAQNLQAQLSYVDLVVPQISSKMLLIDDLLATTDSTLDIINVTALNNLNNATALESITGTLSFVAQPSDSISSMLDVISSQEDVVISKLTVASNLIVDENNIAQGLISDFESTWTILQAIDTSLAQAYSSLSFAGAVINEKFVSYSSVFTMIDTIIANEATVNSQADVYNSMVNVLTNNINTDFNGVFTALDATIINVNNNTSFASSMLSVISSKLPIVQTELGFPIYARNLPLTITTPGRYYLAENINYNGASNAITINTNNVAIDLNGRTLNYTGASSVSGILINNVSNIKIINGTISNFINHNIRTGAAANNNIIVRDVTLINYGIIFSPGSGNNCKFYNNRVFSRINRKLINIEGTYRNMVFDDCVIEGNAPALGDAFGFQIIETAAKDNIQITNCFMAVNNSAIISDAIGMSPSGTITNTVIKNNIMISTRLGINISGQINNNTTAVGNTFTSVGGLSALYLNSSNISGLIFNKNNVMFHGSGIETSVNASSLSLVAMFNNFIQNTLANIYLIRGLGTFLGNFAYNTNAVGNPNNTNYSFAGTSTVNIAGKYVTISQRTGISGAIAPTYWHNINMLP